MPIDEVRISVDLSEVRKVMDELEPKLFAKIARKALREGAKFIAGVAEENIPTADEVGDWLKGQGYNPGDLKRSIKVRTTPKKKRHQQSVSVSMGGEGLGYAMSVEFGSQYQDAQRPMKRAALTCFSQVVETFKNEIAAGVREISS